MADGLTSFHVAHNGEKVLLRQQARWTIVPTMTPPKPGEGALKFDGFEVRVDPPAEWAQMYHEVWRGERDYFYSPQFHGLDLKAAEARYAPYLAAAGSRSDVMYVFGEMLGELTVSHLFVMPGGPPTPGRVRGGLLGADYKMENGRYRFARVLNGESWNPQLRAPLTQPGATVATGEYLLAIDGVDIRPPQDIDARLEARAGHTVAPAGRRRSERRQRARGVGDANRERSRAAQPRVGRGQPAQGRSAEQRPGSRTSICPTPASAATSRSTATSSRSSIGNAVLVDERYNGGGALADYVVDYLRRPLLNFIHGREGEGRRDAVWRRVRPESDGDQRVRRLGR